MSVGAFGALNGYWGQHGVSGIERLANHCDTGIDYVTLGFVNLSPENDPSGYPGTNFAAHCWASTYTNEEGVASNLLSHCLTIQEDIPYCQSKGVKVLLSIGGHYNTGSNNYAVTGEDNGVEFAEFLYSAFGPYEEGYEGPRPFDSVDGEVHNQVDGFDFDIEAELDNTGYIAMVETFRALDASLFISAAPQCPTGDDFFYLSDLIDEAEFDALFIQFYNNPQCELYSDGGLNYFSWVSVIQESSKSKNAKLFFGLPASSVAAGTGYVEPEDLTALICAAKDLPSWGGLSLWDLGRGVENIVSPNRNYIDVAQDALMGIGCPVETPGTTTVHTPTGTATPGPTEPPTTSDAMTTSTVTITNIHTLPCPSDVPCPGGVYVTSVIDTYTTVCPVGWKPTATGNPHAKPTGGAGEYPPTHEKPHGDKPHGGDEKPHGEKPHGGDEKPHGEKPHGGDEGAHEEYPHGGDEKPHGGDEASYGEKPHDDKPYDQTTTIVVVPPPTGVVTPKPEGPTETPVTAGASSLVAGISGLLVIAALQALTL